MECPGARLLEAFGLTRCEAAGPSVHPLAVNKCLNPDVSSPGHPGYDLGPNPPRPATGPQDKGDLMISVVEWLAPIRNAAWVAACFGSLGE